jgi:protein disulfide-isomerase
VRLVQAAGRGSVRKSDFKNYAKDNLVLVKLDFPRGFSLKKKTAEQNDKLAKEFGITGYPSIILLDPDGKKIDQDRL